MSISFLTLGRLCYPQFGFTGGEDHEVPCRYIQHGDPKIRQCRH